MCSYQIRRGEPGRRSLLARPVESRAMTILDGRSVLVTGGTGSFGKRFVAAALRETGVRKVVVLSRDELKQFEMQQAFPNDGAVAGTSSATCGTATGSCVAFFEIDIVIHAAALERVPAAEYNPFEFVKTNVIGAMNVIDAAVDCGSRESDRPSTDKAGQPSQPLRGYQIG